MHKDEDGNTTVTDRDSQPNNVDKNNYGTTSQEDDDDFEDLIMLGEAMDLALRKFITSINGVAPTVDRTPAIDAQELEKLKNGAITTTNKVHPKDALATGNKTKNGALGVKKDLETKVNSVASWAKNKGCRVGISTSVSVDHATPAAFYAHQGQRSSYYNVGLDLIDANFDFYAGSDFLDPTNKKAAGSNSESLYTLVDKAGYTIARGYKDYQKKAKKSDKLILLQPATATDNSAIPYAIDRKKGDMTLTEITRAGINFLSKDLSKGFFLMVEGGKIDWACHSNDAATVFHEVMDMDNAIKVAYEFYEQHPNKSGSSLPAFWKQL